MLDVDLDKIYTNTFCSETHSFVVGQFIIQENLLVTFYKTKTLKYYANKKRMKYSISLSIIAFVSSNDSDDGGFKNKKKTLHVIQYF